MHTRTHTYLELFHAHRGNAKPQLSVLLDVEANTLQVQDGCLGEDDQFLGDLEQLHVCIGCGCGAVEHQWEGRGCRVADRKNDRAGAQDALIAVAVAVVAAAAFGLFDVVSHGTRLSTFGNEIAKERQRKTKIQRNYTKDGHTRNIWRAERVRLRERERHDME